VLDDGAVGDPDLPLLEHRRHRHHDRELLGVAAEVVGHRDDGLAIVTGQDHLRGLVEQLRVGLGHVEPTERERARGGEDDREQRDGQGDE